VTPAYKCSHPIITVVCHQSPYTLQNLELLYSAGNLLESGMEKRVQIMATVDLYFH